MKSGSTTAAKAIIRLTTLFFMLVLLALGGPVCAHADVTISRKSATIKIGTRRRMFAMHMTIAIDISARYAPRENVTHSPATPSTSDRRLKILAALR